MGSTHPRHHYSLGVNDGGSVAPRGAAGFATPAWLGRRTMALLLVGACLTSTARAQAAEPPNQASIPIAEETPKTVVVPFKSMADSLAWERAKYRASTAAG